MADEGTGRIAVVTGGTGSLGRGVVQALVDRGWTVHVPWVAEGETDALEARLGERMASVHLARCDVTDAGSVEDFFRGIEAATGGALHLLCNLVGGFAMAPLGETDPGTWRKMMEMNATSAFLCTRAALPMLRAGAGVGPGEGGADGRGPASGGAGGTGPAPDGGGGSDPASGGESRGGPASAGGAGDGDRSAGEPIPVSGASVVNVAALPPLKGGGDGMAAYAASKGTVVALTRALGEELRGDGIRVNAVAPEIIDTAANREAMPDADRSTWLQPGEIARVIAFLAEPDAAVVTGSVLELKKG